MMLKIKKTCIAGRLPKKSTATPFFIHVPFPINTNLIRKSAFSVGDELTSCHERQARYGHFSNLDVLMVSQKILKPSLR